MAKNEKKRLYRVEGESAKLLGVCGGLAEYFDIDPTIIRVIWLVSSIVYGVGIVAYFAFALCMPRKSEIK